MKIAILFWEELGTYLLPVVFDHLYSLCKLKLLMQM